MSKEANKAPRRIGAVCLLLAEESIPLELSGSMEIKLRVELHECREEECYNIRVSVALKTSWKTRFNVQCLMVWCEPLHPLIKSNQVLPLGVGPEPKSTKSRHWSRSAVHDPSFVSEILSHQAAVTREQMRLSRSSSNPMISFVSRCVTILFSHLISLHYYGHI